MVSSCEVPRTMSSSCSDQAFFQFRNTLRERPIPARSGQYTQASTVRHLQQTNAFADVHIDALKPIGKVAWTECFGSSEFNIIPADCIAKNGL